MNLRGFLILKGRIEEERTNAERLLDTLRQKGYLGPGDPTAPEGLQDEFTLRAVASILLDYYSAAENIFKEIAKRIDGNLPKGDEWHKDLLLQMKLSLPGLRPAVLTPDTFGLLDEYRRFRHLVRNIYGFNLIPERVFPLIRNLPKTDAAFASDLAKFLKSMEDILGCYSPNLE
ncbi:MAG: hypothetical protein PWQ86_2084 [Bacillota bacterium]|nr:hypothetical protein [Bacillota bacterium]